MPFGGKKCPIKNALSTKERTYAPMERTSLMGYAVWKPVNSIKTNISRFGVLNIGINLERW